MTRRPTGRRWLPEWFTSLLWVTLLSMAVLSGVRTLISYRALALGGDAVTVGVITAAFAVIPLFVALPLGRRVDRGQGVAVLRVGAILTVIAVMLAAWSPGLAVIAIASMLLGFGQILTTIACQGLIPLWSDPKDFDRKFGHITLAVSTGQFLGFPIAGAVATVTAIPGSSHVTTTPALLVLAGVAALAVPFSFVFRRGSAHRPLTRKKHAESRQSTFTLLKTPGMKPAIYSSLTVLTGIDLLAVYLPVLGQQTGISVGVIAVLLTARTLASVVSRMALPWLLRAFKRRTLLVSATLCSSIPLFLLPAIPFPVVLGILMVIIGFFFGIGQPLSMSWVATVADSNNRAAALSIRLAGNRAGQVVLPLAAGGIAGIVGIGAVFNLTGLLLLSAAIVTYRATRNLRDGL